jgi:hypothetical protein
MSNATAPPVAITFKKEPHRQQQLAIEQSDPEQLYGGAKRGGKTIQLAQKSFLLSFLFPGNRGLMTRYNFTDLQDSTLMEYFETVPSEFIAGHNKGERTIFIRNPHKDSGQKDAATKDGWSRYTSRQHYRGLGDPDDFEKVKGMSLGHLEIDEPSEVPFETYLMIRAQMTWILPDGTRPPYMCLLASNPEPGWVEDRFVAGAVLGDDGVLRGVTDGCCFIPALPSDNPHLPPGYVEELISTYPKEWVEKYVKGGWGSSEGAVFKELSDDVHNLDNWVDTESDLATVRFSLRLDTIGGFDHGDSGTTCYIQVGVDTSGNIFVFDEYYRKDRLVADHAIDILATKSRYESGVAGLPISPPRRQRFTIADPTVITRQQQQTSDGLKSIGWLYVQHGIPMIPGWNAVEMSIERIKEHLHPLDRHVHPFTGKLGSPTLFISKRRCPNLWRELRGWKRKRVAGRSDAQAAFMEYKGPDHAIDPLRYIVNAQPRRREFCETDMMGMTAEAQRAQKMHAKWAAKFGKPQSQKYNSIFK